MVSPANTYPGLTEGGPGTEAGEPDNYYPSGTRNYARVVWNDQFQGAANAQYAKELGLKKIFILNDGETYGLGIATLRLRLGRRPLLLGGGKRLFPQGTHTVFQLKSATPYPSGVVGLHYERARQRA